MPSALVSASGVEPLSRPAASVPPKMPQTDVGWKPRLWNALGAAMPMRVTVSLPMTIAVRSSRPLRPATSAAASAAGETTAETCATEPGWVSSKSSPWQSMALANAALAPGSARSSPITVASGVPACSSIIVRPSVATPMACAARPQPIVSRKWSFAASTTSWGISS